MNQYFYCYSRPLKNYLVSNGERFISKAIHEKTKKKYWIFEGNKNLNELLTVWRSHK